MNNEEINACLCRAEEHASRGIYLADKARDFFWCVEKKRLLYEAESAFRQAAEELSFVKDMR